MKTIMKNLFRFLARWNELISLPLAILLWAFSPELIRMIDPTAGVYDAGIFQIIIFTLIQFFLFTGISWLYLKLVFPRGYDVLDELFNNPLNQISLWQKSKLALCLFSLLLLSLVLLSRVI
jgi:hypothetical protein